jgi:hypothetical protein
MAQIYEARSLLLPAWLVKYKFSLRQGFEEFLLKKAIYLRGG